MGEEPKRGRAGDTRPLGLGGRLRWALRIGFGTKLTQIGLLLVIALIQILVGIVMTVLLRGAVVGLQQLTTEPNPDPAALLAALASPTVLAAVAVYTLAQMLLWAVYQGALLRLAPAYFRHGRRPPFGEILKGGLSRAPDLVSVMVLLSAPPLLWTLALMGLGDPADPVQVAQFGGLGLLLGVVWGLLLFLVLPVAANEAVSPWRAFGRAWRLASGQRLAFLGNALVMLAILVGVAFGGVALLGLLAAGAAQAAPALVLFVMPVGYVALLLVLLFLTTAFHALLSLFYLEGRVRHEGACFDWALMPGEDWPRCEAQAPQPKRGLRAWGGFIVINGLGAAALFAVVPLLTPELATVSSPTGVRQAIPGPQAGGGTEAIEPARRAAPAGQAIRFGEGTLEVVRDAFLPDPKDPTLWITVRAHGLFPDRAPGDAVSIRVSVVRGRDGRDLYNASSPYEGGSFEVVQWQQAKGSGRWEGSRTVHLLPGTEAAEIEQLRGTLVLKGSDIGQVEVPFTLAGGPSRSPVRFRVAGGRVMPLAGGRVDAAGANVPDAGGAVPEDPSEAAYAHYQAGRYREAIRLLDRVIAEEPDNAWAWYTRSWSYWKLGDKEKAWADVARACDLGYQDACKLKKR